MTTGALQRERGSAVHWARTRLLTGDRAKWTHRLVIWGALLVAWEVFGWVVGPFFFPRFSSVAGDMLGVFTNGDMATLLISLRQMLAGFVLAAVVGIPIGMLMGASRVLDHLLSIYVNALFVTSLEALLPFLIILVGTEFRFRVAVVFLFSLFWIVINTSAGVRAVGRDLMETAESFCAPRRKVFTAVMLPGALPYIMAGLRLGLAMSIKGMVIAELWITVGLGRRLIDLGFARELSQFFALAVWVIVISAGSAQILASIQRRMSPWAEDIVGMGGSK